MTDIETDVRKTDPDTVPDEQLVDALEPYDQEAKAYGAEVIGHLSGGPLVEDDAVEGVPQVFVAESALVDLIHQVQLYYSGAQVSAASSFSSHYNIPAGDITRNTVAAIYRYQNSLYKVKMNGKQLRQALEWSAGYYHQWQDGDRAISFDPDRVGFSYMMFAGVQYEINIRKPNGERIENLCWMDGTPVQDTDEFTVAVTDHFWNTNLGQYGSIFHEKDGDELPVLLEKDMGGSIDNIRDMIVDYIQNVKHGEITPELYHNWKIVGNE